MGFGIGTPGQARQVGALPKEHRDNVADKVIGSVCVKMIGESEKPVETAKEFAGSFRDALA